MRPAPFLCERPLITGKRWLRRSIHIFTRSKFCCTYSTACHRRTCASPPTINRHVRFRLRAKRTKAHNEQTVLLRESDLWSKREQWLREHQPVFHGAGDASALLDQLKQIAGKYSVLIENPAIGNSPSAGAYQSVFASIETKSPWPPLVHFLYDVQAPDAFIVFESANIAIDPSDPTQMRGKFKIARWYAPVSAAK